MISNLPTSAEDSYFDMECLLTVAGDTILLNTFDKTFRSGFGPQWADRPISNTPRYSMHALYPVPEEIQRRGFDSAGSLWCKTYWGIDGDLRDLEVKRFLGRRHYRFFVPGGPPKNLLHIISRSYPLLQLHLAVGGVDETILYQTHQDSLTMYHFSDGYSRRSTGGSFSSRREEMGF